MADEESEYPAIAADAVTNPESARLLALLKKADKALKEYVPPISSVASLPRTE